MLEHFPGRIFPKPCAGAAAALVICLLPSFARNTPSRQEQKKMSEILNESKKYCRRLAEAALNFVCVEDVSEQKIDIVRFVDRIGRGMGHQVREQDVTRKHSYLFDYQFIRKNDRKIEKRILLEQDGKEKREEVTRLKTTMFEYKNVLFGPINLLAEDRQLFFDYRMVGNDLLDGIECSVIEASPRHEFQSMMDGGTIWIENKNSTILRIEWTHDRMVRSKIINDMAGRYKGEPRITHAIEFGFEKNGIRFPSRYFIEEAYIKKKGKIVIHSQTDVLYKDYKFFTVETEVRYDKVGLIEQHVPRG